MFNYLAELETDDEFLSYLEKYSDLKLKFTGHPIDPDVKVTFITNSSSYYNKIIQGKPAVCDPFTRIIFFDPHFWRSQEGYERTRERVLFHELGHCDLYRNHSSLEDSSFMRVRGLETLLASHPTNLDDIFNNLYEELFAERNTIHIKCYTIEIDEDGLERRITPNHCMPNQNRAFQDFKDISVPIFQQLIGLFFLRNYNSRSL